MNRTSLLLHFLTETAWLKFGSVRRCARSFVFQIRACDDAWHDIVALSLHPVRSSTPTTASTSSLGDRAWRIAISEPRIQGGGL